MFILKKNNLMLKVCFRIVSKQARLILQDHDSGNLVCGSWHWWRKEKE